MLEQDKEIAMAKIAEWKVDYYSKDNLKPLKEFLKEEFGEENIEEEGENFILTCSDGEILFIESDGDIRKIENDTKKKENTFTMNQLIDEEIVRVEKIEDHFGDCGGYFYAFIINDMEEFAKILGFSSLEEAKNTNYYTGESIMPFIVESFEKDVIKSRVISDIKEEIDYTDEDQIYVGIEYWQPVDDNYEYTLEFNRWDISGDKLTSLDTDDKFPIPESFLSVYGNTKLKLVSMEEILPFIEME